MTNEQLLSELENERKELESEFIQLGKELKTCKDSETRKNLQELKKEIQFDLDDIKIQIEEIKNQPKEETITNTTKNEENEIIAD
jgi:hypothetical protein